MADDKLKNRPAAPAGETSAEEQDVLFRAQMGVWHVILGYWRHAAVVIGAGLVVVLVYGLYQDWRTGQQEEWQAAIAAVDVKVPPPDPLAQYGLGPMDDPNDAAKMGKLAESAKAYEAVAADASGSASTMAWLRAADLWARAGKVEEAKSALEKAHANASPGALGWAARSSLAAKRAEAGDLDGAAALYREAANGKDFYAERALYELGGLYAAAGRKEDAGKAWEEFGSRFADSTLADEVAAARGQLVGGGS